MRSQDRALSMQLYTAVGRYSNQHGATIISNVFFNKQLTQIIKNFTQAYVTEKFFQIFKQYCIEGFMQKITEINYK